MARTRKRFNAINNPEVNTDTIVSSSGSYKVALYARLSEESVARPSESIENQLELMKRFIGDKPELSRYREFVDRAYSGTNYQRPAFQKMMQEVKARRINCIIVKDMSRLGREFLDTCNLIEVIFPFLNVRFISVNDHYDTAEEAGGNKTMEIAIKNMVNDMYARDISKRVSAVREQEIAQGRFIGSNAPYGYKVNKEHPLRQLVIDPPAAAVVREMFDMVLEGATLADISKEFQSRRLNNPGEYAKTNCLYSKDPDKPGLWRAGTISTMLKNEAYIGNMVQGKRKKRLCDGMPVTRQDEEDRVVVRGTHESIVSEEVFMQVKNELEKRYKEGVFAVSRTDEIPMKKSKYTGIIFCGRCGERMMWSSEIKGRKRRYFFTCPYNRYRDTEDRCRTTISEIELEKILFASLETVYKNATKNAGEMDIKGILKSKLSKEEQRYQIERKRLADKMGRLDAGLAEKYELYTEGVLSREQFSSESMQVKEKVAAIENEMSGLEIAFAEFKTSIKKRMKFTCFLSDGIKEKSISAELLHMLVRRIDVYENHRIQITYNFEEPKGDRRR